MNSDLIYRLKKRAEIRRNATTRKSVVNGEPDRISDLLEEAAEALQELSSSTRSDGWPKSQPERQLRRMLCASHHGIKAYMDDGEASFCVDEFHRSIDYMTETPEAIQQAWLEAVIKMYNKTVEK